MKAVYLLPLMVGICLGQPNPDSHAYTSLTANDADQPLPFSADELVMLAFPNNLIIGFELLSTRNVPKSIAKFR
jgi:hypothetical protein